jgi:hypothetical protein
LACSTHFWKGSDLLVPITVEVLLCVVDGHSTVDTVGKGGVLHDGHALEEHGHSPIVAKECQKRANVCLANQVPEVF